MTLFTFPSWSVSMLPVGSCFHSPSATNCTRTCQRVGEDKAADCWLQQ